MTLLETIFLIIPKKITPFKICPFTGVEEVHENKGYFLNRPTVSVQ